jgi:hypothetical protein
MNICKFFRNAIAKDLSVHVAMHDETNEGWVWTRDFNSRSIVRILNPANNKSVYCQVRKIDPNFCYQYNKKPRKFISEQNVLVISQWYRDALGITDEQRNAGSVALRIVLMSCFPFLLWASVRAAAHHPDITVRLGTRLGILGGWLGLVGVSFPLLDMYWDKHWYKLFVSFLSVMILFGVGWIIGKQPIFQMKSKDDE